MKKKKPMSDEIDDKKSKDLQKDTVDNEGKFMTTNQGVRINDDQNSLKAGDRGPTLLEDFHLREKITHFDHERIPERIVHARGSAAHGYFELTESLSQYTKAKFLQKPGTRTPVFARFSTVAGSRGSTDLARDVRGFAVKFYTEEGNYDLVGNNMPIFFIQDALKFPDLIHAVKPEPNNEIPQAASAHDTFWDFVSLTPETMHNVMWLMSDRAIPRSLRMMEGFGIHTFRFVNSENKSVFVRFHWKPLLGVHSVLWDEAQKISGKDPDFHRRDLYDTIANGIPAEWDFGVQIVEEKDEHKFNFDLLDPTKLIPEELVPVKIVGRMTLNRNPDNFFAETEQVAFHPGHVVPGIDFSNDPLLQGRLFSYTDTQLIRLGGPNFHEIPINRPIAPVHNNQRDGYMRQTINPGQASYNPNSTGGGHPHQAKASEGGYVSYHERIDAHKVRARSKSFMDHFSQPAMFYNSQSEIEKNHIVDAFRFELGKVKQEAIRERVVGLLTKIDKSLAERVAKGLGIKIPKGGAITNHSVPADADPKSYQSKEADPDIQSSAALSMENTVKNTIKSRQIAILAADGVIDESIHTMKTALENEGAMAKIVSVRLGNIKTVNGKTMKVDESFLTTSSVLFDAVFIPSGKKSVSKLMEKLEAIEFIAGAYNHCKAIAADVHGTELLMKVDHLAQKGQKEKYGGILIDAEPEDFVNAIAQHRFWGREMVREKK
jgi:catalase